MKPGIQPEATESAPDMDTPARARHNMVESQIRTNKVTDERLLAALRGIPREHFVPRAQEGIAYVDEDIPIGNGRYLMEPMVMARLLQEAEVEKDDIALEVGAGSGYASAVLARLAGTVVALEHDEDLVLAAGQAFSELGIDNAVAVQGELHRGYAKQGPYNVILLSGMVPDLPPALENQLADGGRLLGVFGGDGGPAGQGMGRAMLYRKSGGVISGQVLFDAATPMLPGFAREESFVF